MDAINFIIDAIIPIIDAIAENSPLNNRKSSSISIYTRGFSLLH